MIGKIFKPDMLEPDLVFPKGTFNHEVRELEKKLFPVFKEGTGYLKGRMIQFAPSYYFANGLLDEEVVEDLKKSDKGLLSMGSGQAFLERLLVKMGVDAEQIVLSDKKSRIMPRKG